MYEKHRIVIAGGTGFFGNYLVNYFKSNYKISVLTRGKGFSENGVDYINWDGKSIGDWVNSIEGAKALINLSGKSINCKFTNKNKAKLLSSRIDSTRVLVDSGSCISSFCPP